MPRKSKQNREYRFKIDAFTPSTIPMVRLAQYLTDLSVMLGQEKSVHFVRVEEGSTIPVIMVEWEAEPKVRERVKAVKHNEAPQNAQQAARDIDRKLSEDNAKGFLLDPSGAKVIQFPGRERFLVPEFGPVSQPGMFQGVPIKIGGENDPVPVHLEDGKQKYIVLAKRSLAKEIASYLFTTVVRVEGTGRWTRNSDGEWIMHQFYAHTVMPIEDADIRKNIDELRAVSGSWKKSEDPLAVLGQIRSGGKLQ